MARHNNRAQYVLFDKYPKTYLVFRYRQGLVWYIKGNDNPGQWMTFPAGIMSDEDDRAWQERERTTKRNAEGFRRYMGKNGFKAKYMTWNQVEQYIFNIQSEDFLNKL